MGAEGTHFARFVISQIIKGWTHCSLVIILLLLDEWNEAFDGRNSARLPSSEQTLSNNLQHIKDKDNAILITLSSCILQQIN